MTLVRTQSYVCVLVLCLTYSICKGGGSVDLQTVSRARTACGVSASTPYMVVNASSGTDVVTKSRYQEDVCTCRREPEQDQDPSFLGACATLMCALGKSPRASPTTSERMVLVTYPAPAKPSPLYGADIVQSFEPTLSRVCVYGVWGDDGQKDKDDHPKNPLAVGPATFTAFGTADENSTAVPSLALINMRLSLTFSLSLGGPLDLRNSHIEATINTAGSPLSTLGTPPVVVLAPSAVEALSALSNAWENTSLSLTTSLPILSSWGVLLEAPAQDVAHGARAAIEGSTTFALNRTKNLIGCDYVSVGPVGSMELALLPSLVPRPHGQVPVCVASPFLSNVVQVGSPFISFPPCVDVFGNVQPCWGSYPYPYSSNNVVVMHPSDLDALFFSGVGTSILVAPDFESSPRVSLQTFEAVYTTPVWNSTLANGTSSLINLPVRSNVSVALATFCFPGYAFNLGAQCSFCHTTFSNAGSGTTSFSFLSPTSSEYGCIPCPKDRVCQEFGSRDDVELDLEAREGWSGTEVFSLPEGFLFLPPTYIEGFFHLPPGSVTHGAAGLCPVEAACLHESLCWTECNGTVGPCWVVCVPMHAAQSVRWRDGFNKTAWVHEWCDYGFEGPFCSQCSSGFSRRVDGICKPCPKERNVSVPIVVIMGFLTVFMVVLLFARPVSVRKTAPYVAEPLYHSVNSSVPHSRRSNRRTLLRWFKVLSWWTLQHWNDLTAAIAELVLLVLLAESGISKPLEVVLLGAAMVSLLCFIPLYAIYDYKNAQRSQDQHGEDDQGDDGHGSELLLSSLLFEEGVVFVQIQTAVMEAVFDAMAGNGVTLDLEEVVPGSMHTVFSLLQHLNFSLPELACFNADMTYVEVTMATLAIMPLLALTVVLGFGLRAALIVWQRRRGGETDGVDPMDALKRKFSLALVNVYLLLFFPTMSRIFSALGCANIFTPGQGVTVRVITAAPHVTCDSPEYHQLAAICYATLAVLTGIALFKLYLSLHPQHRTLAVVKHLVHGLVPKLRFYWLLSLGARALLAAAFSHLTLFEGQELTCLVLVVGIHVQVRPYVLPSVNMIKLVTLSYSLLTWVVLRSGTSQETAVVTFLAGEFIIVAAIAVAIFTPPIRMVWRLLCMRWPALAAFDTVRARIVARVRRVWTRAFGSESDESACLDRGGGGGMYGSIHGSM